MKNKILLLVSAVILLSTNVYAATFSGTGDPISDPALSGGTMETFDAGPAGDHSTLPLGNVTYTGIDAPFTIGSDFIGSYNTRGVFSIYNGGDYIPSNFRFDFTTPVGAIGFNWGAADEIWLLSAYDASDTLLDSYAIAPTLASNLGEYFGIQAPNIAYVTLVNQGAGDYVFVDNFTHSGASAPPMPVPALSPLMLMLMAIVLAGFGFLGFRRRS